MALIKAMTECLKPGGVLLIALATPYNPFIDGGELSGRFEYLPLRVLSHMRFSSLTGKAGRRPEQPLPILGRGFEEQASSFVMNVAWPLGLTVMVGSQTRNPDTLRRRATHHPYLLIPLLNRPSQRRRTCAREICTRLTTSSTIW
jgi:hypothetical protein